MSEGTTRRSFRCEDEKWERAKAKAEAEGTTLSAVLHRKLDEFLTDPPPEE